MSYLVVIPARYRSTRLPGKPLVTIDGVPMIVRTYRQCIKAVPANRVVVATDDVRIVETCVNEGISTVMTSGKCLTGTDRVAEVAEKYGAETYINVQGDEPIFNPEDLSVVVNTALQYPQDIINGYSIIEKEEQFRSSSTPKVVMRPDGRLLYMSRAGIPTSKKLAFVQGYRQIGVYAYPAAALLAFRAYGCKTPLEEVEDIEVIRFLEMGYEVRMVRLSAESISVDEPEDIAKIVSSLKGIRNIKGA